MIRKITVYIVLCLSRQLFLVVVLELFIENIVK